jgi:hypothetical protein
VNHDSMAQSVLFEGLAGKSVVTCFDQPDSSSDAGALLLGSVEKRLGLIAAVADVLSDGRERGKIRHSLTDLVAQRVFGISCGYEDCSDAARLRDDPIQRMLLSRDPVDGSPLASQPTLSRFENSVSKRDLLGMGYALMDKVIARHRKRLGTAVKRITIDLDSTEDETHGLQQGSLFNGFYGSHCYLPMLGFLQFDGEGEQYLFASMLRPGNANARAGALSILKRLLPRLRTAFPKAKVRVRLDGGFAAPEVFTFLERENLEFVAGIAKNQVLARTAEPLLDEAREASLESGESERYYGDTNYQAGSWERPRRVVVKAEVTRYPGRAARDNPRFLVTNITGNSSEIYEDAYAARGDVENRIKELKAGLCSDRTSCSRFLANQMRLLLASIAFVIYQELRLCAAGTTLAKAQVATLRERLIKLGGWVKRTTRRIVIHLPGGAPWQHEWCRIAKALNPQPA